MLSNEVPNYQRLANELVHCNRLAIVGNQGAGKSTLAEKLVEPLGLEYVEWDPDQATTFRERLSRQERWIVDGEYVGGVDHVDRVIFLDFPVTLCLWRATKRAFNYLCLWPLASPAVLLRIPPKLLKLFWHLTDIVKASFRPCPATASGWMPNAETIVFTSPQQVDRLLDALYARKRFGVRIDTEGG